MKQTKKPRAISQLATSIVAEDTGGRKVDETASNKNPHAVALDRLGAIKGGPGRSKKLTKKKSIDIARKAALTCWKKNYT